MLVDDPILVYELFANHAKIPRILIHAGGTLVEALPKRTPPRRAPWLLPLPTLAVAEAVPSTATLRPRKSTWALVSAKIYYPDVLYGSMWQLTLRGVRTVS